MFLCKAVSWNHWRVKWGRSSSHWGDGVLVVGVPPMCGHRLNPAWFPHNSSSLLRNGSNKPPQLTENPACPQAVSTPAGSLSLKVFALFYNFAHCWKKWETALWCHLERFPVKLITFVALFIIFASKLWNKYQFREVVCKWHRKNAEFIPFWYVVSSCCRFMCWFIFLTSTEITILESL